jgi:hypothetical protein
MEVFIIVMRQTTATAIEAQVPIPCGTGEPLRAIDFRPQGVSDRIWSWRI